MKRIIFIKPIITSASILIVLQEGLTTEQHEHVHHELPECEVITDSAFYLSGTTNNGYVFYDDYKYKSSSKTNKLHLTKPIRTTHQHQSRIEKETLSQENTLICECD